MRITGGSRGVYLDGADYCTVRRVEVSSCSVAGIYAFSADSVTFASNIIHHCDYGIYVIYGYGSVIENNTIVRNARSQIYVVDADSDVLPPVTIRNNILWADGPTSATIGGQCYRIISDYNNTYVTNGAFPTLTDWQLRSGHDVHSMSRQPMFVDVDNGDYHLQSTAGSYRGGAWTADAASSPCIDTGIGEAGDEPAPNTTPFHAPGLGQRNMGAYGGTEQASKTPAARQPILKEPVGKETYPVQSIPVDIRWTWVGMAWQPGDTLSLGYSPDSGATWHPVPGADVVPFDSGTFSWDISGVRPGPHYRAKATCNQDGAVADQSAEDFRIGITKAYYVNDADTANDFWCTAPGDDANDGLTPATPKATVQAILDEYDVDPGDTVRIDTGTYVSPLTIWVHSLDQGSASAPVTFEGSPFGTTMSATGGGPMGASTWRLYGCSHVILRRMRVTGVDAAIMASSASHCHGSLQNRPPRVTSN
jgi:parallel beta-helix repeat protein